MKKWNLYNQNVKSNVVINLGNPPGWMQMILQKSLFVEYYEQLSATQKNNTRCVQWKWNYATL